MVLNGLAADEMKESVNEDWVGLEGTAPSFHHRVERTGVNRN